MARVRKGTSRREPDVVIGTDAATWLRLRRGELAGLDAFREWEVYDHVTRQMQDTLDALAAERRFPVIG